MSALEQGAEQEGAHVLASTLRVERDRELGCGGVDESVARRVGCEQPVPRRADRFVAAVERDDRGVARATPVLHVTPQLGPGERLVERRAFLGAVVLPVDGFVQHLGEERRIRASAEPEHGTGYGLALGSP